MYSANGLFEYKYRTDPVKKMERALETKKQQSMSNCRFIIVSSLLRSEQSQNDRRLHITFPLLDAIQDVVATLFDERGRVVLSSCHAVLRGPFG